VLLGAPPAAACFGLGYRSASASFLAFDAASAMARLRGGCFGLPRVSALRALASASARATASVSARALLHFRLGAFLGLLQSLFHRAFWFRARRARPSATAALGFSCARACFGFNARARFRFGFCFGFELGFGFSRCARACFGIGLRLGFHSRAHARFGFGFGVDASCGLDVDLRFGTGLCRGARLLLGLQFGCGFLFGFCFSGGVRTRLGVLARLRFGGGTRGRLGAGFGVSLGFSALFGFEVELRYFFGQVKSRSSAAGCYTCRQAARKNFLCSHRPPVFERRVTVPVQTGFFGRSKRGICRQQRETPVERRGSRMVLF
jgi:hypothetical protein